MQKLISFRRLKGMCVYYTASWERDCELTTRQCSRKNCPIWKRMRNGKPTERMVW